MSVAVCLLMITSISSSITQNIGQLQNTEQHQNIGQPTSSSSGTGGLADSPWPMFRGNVRHTGLSPYDTSFSNSQLLWDFNAGKDVHSSPTISPDGTIYFGSRNQRLYALNPDGSEKWNFLSGGVIHWSSPSISSDGTVYFGSMDHKLYAINEDGTEKWNFATNGIIYSSSPAISSDGMIYIGSDDANLYAINPDGTVKWSFITGSNIRTSPAIGPNGTIYICSFDHKLYAINPDGTEKWNFTTGADIRSSPTISSDNIIYFGSNDNKLYAINQDGTEKWNFTAGGNVFSSPAIDSHGTIYFGSQDHKFYAINPNGTLKWSFTTGYWILSSPSIGSEGTIYFGSHDKNFYALNPDGTMKWSYKTNGSSETSPAISSNGIIYFGTHLQGSSATFYAIGAPTPPLDVTTTSHFTELNSAAQSTITVHVIDGTNPVQGATVNLVSDNGGIFSPQSGITDAKGDLKSIFNAPTVTSQIICKISAEASKTSYNDGSGYVDVTINPIPWPMFRQNLNHTGQSPYDTNTNNGKLKWSFLTGARVVSSPAIGSDGTIYVGSFDNKLYAINPDGTEKWYFTTGAEVFSSPTIDSEGTIYIGSHDNKLYAINPDGTEKWNFTTGDMVYSSPAVGSDGTIYVGSHDHKLYAINPDGTQKWNFTTGQSVRSLPAIGFDGTIYISSYDYKIYAINPGGSEKWNFVTGGQVASSPAISSDGTIYVGSQDEKLYALNHEGIEKWNFTTKDWVWASPAIGSDGTIYIGSYDDKIYAINVDGSEKWNFTTDENIHSSPAIGSDGTIYCGSNDGIFYGINPDGSLKWNFTTDGIVFSSPAIDVDGTIYVGSYDNKLYAIGAPIPGIIVEKTANVSVAKSGDLIEYTIYYNNTSENMIYETSQQQLTFENKRQFGPNYNPDGSRIVYTATEDGGSYNDIWIMDADGSNHQQLTFEDYNQQCPSFSPDGGKIIYVSQEDGGASDDIWIMDADGSNHQQLTFENEYQFSPNFSPDGSKIVYTSTEDGGYYRDIWIMDVDGNNHHQLTFENYRQQYPSFSPDGTKIIYSSYEDGGGFEDIWIMDVDGTNHQQLTLENNRQFNPHLSPDGSRIVYTATEDGGSYRDIWIMNADGSNHQQLTFENYRQQYPSFSPDSTRIVYSSEEDGGAYEDIWVFNLVPTGTQVKKVWINDTLPPEVAFVTSSAEANRTGDYNWIFYDIGPGEHNFTITAQINNSVPNGTILMNFVHLDIIDKNGIPMPDSWDSVDVLVLAPETKPPIADAGPDQTVNEGDVVHFDGSGSVGSSGGQPLDSNIVALWHMNESMGNVIYDETDNHNDGAIHGANWVGGKFNEALSFDGINDYVSIPDDDSLDDMLEISIEAWIYVPLNTTSNRFIIAKDSGTNNHSYALRFDIPNRLQFYVLSETGGEGVVYTVPAVSNEWLYIVGTYDGDTVRLFLNGTEVGTRNGDITGKIQNSMAQVCIGRASSLNSGYFNGIIDEVVIRNGALTAQDILDYYNSGKEHFIDEELPLGKPAEITSYEWDFDASDGLWWETGAPPDATGPTPTHVYGDDGVYIVTLRVTDNDSLSATDTCNITIQNVDPTVSIESITMEVEIGLRVAGRKYNNVSMALYENGSLLGYVSIERLPCSPDEQMAWIPVSINFSKTYNATVTFTPKDPPNVGGNPVWIYIKSQNGSIKKIHNTFNVQQSKKRDSEHWNHIDPWEVDLNEELKGCSFEVKYHVSDPGSDDEILTFSYGSQTKNVTHLNAPPNPDPYPSPEINPVDITDTTTLIYEGTGTVTLVVKDDDNIRLGVGEGSDSIDVG